MANHYQYIRTAQKEITLQTNSQKLKNYTVKTLADFKRRIVKGAKISSQLFWCNTLADGTKTPWQLQQEHPEREISIVQSNSFAIKTWRETEKKFVDSWCSYPKAKELTIIDENTAAIEEPGIKIIYKFLPDSKDSEILPVNEVDEEDEDDDRIFTINDLYDLAYDVAQKAMAAGFEGKKSIDGKTIEQYINDEIKDIPGS